MKFGNLLEICLWPPFTVKGLKNVIAKASLAALSPQLFRPFGDGFFKLSEKIARFGPVFRQLAREWVKLRFAEFAA